MVICQPRASQPLVGRGGGDQRWSTVDNSGSTHLGVFCEGVPAGWVRMLGHDVVRYAQRGHLSVNAFSDISMDVEVETQAGAGQNGA